MNTNLYDIAQTGIAISIFDLIIALTLSIMIGLGVALVYRWTHRGLNYERSFLITLVMVGPIVAVIMMLIGSNLALSLGMVGALSIIRFRTVIKDTRDMIYLFWMIAVGLGCGTYNWKAIAVACIFIAVILVFLHSFEYGKSRHSDYVLVISGSAEEAIEIIKDRIKSVVFDLQLRSLDVSETEWEAVFEIRMAKKEILQEEVLVNDLKNISGISKVNLLAPQLALPL